MLAIQAAVFKMPALTQGNFGCWEEGVVWSPKSFTEQPDPVLNDQLDVGADWEECRGDRLGIFGSDLTRILINAPMGQIDVLGGTSPRTMKLAFSRNGPSTGTMRSQAIVFA